MDCRSFETLREADEPRAFELLGEALQDIERFDVEPECLQSLGKQWLARGPSGHAVFVQALGDADVTPFKALVSAMDGTRVVGASAVLFDRFRTDSNPHVYLLSAETFLDLGGADDADGELRARFDRVARRRLRRAKGWGRVELEALLEERGLL